MGDEQLQQTLQEMCLDDEVRGDETFSAKDELYVQRIIAGVAEKEPILDRLIDRYVSGWTVDRLPKVELAVLRLGIYELLYCDDIPAGVTINECVDLVKRFSLMRSSAYVNGILSSCKEEDPASVDIHQPLRSHDVDETETVAEETEMQH